MHTVYKMSNFNKSNYLFVEKKILLTVPPKIHAAEDHYTVVENSQAVLSCVADGMPAPSVTWRKGDTSLVAKHSSESHGDFIVEKAKVSLS